MMKKIIVFALAVLLLSGCYSLALPVEAESTIEGTGAWRKDTFSNTGDDYISMHLNGNFDNSIQDNSYATGSVVVADSQNAVSFSVRPYGNLKETRSGMARFVMNDAESGKKIASGYGELNGSTFRFYNGHAKKFINTFIEERDVKVSLECSGCVYRFVLKPAGFVNAVRMYMLK